ncbi:MAG: hypothetical protein WCO60_05920 [Verrucomicrobiota bacterium]
MTTTELQLLHGYLSETLSETEFAELQSLLRSNAEARKTLRVLSTVDTRLVEMGAGGAALSTGLVPISAGIEWERPKSQFPKWRPWLAAAAGVIVGLFSATMVFAYVVPLASKTVCLLNDSFESGPVPLAKGMPKSPGVWSGDYSAVVGEQQGIKPLSGTRMLRILRADYEGKTPQFSYSGDLYRILDLRQYQADLVDGKALVSVEANVQAIPHSSANSYMASIAINAMDTLPSEDISDFARLYLDRLSREQNDGVGEFIPASAQRGFKLNPEGGKWQKGRLEMRVPPGTKFLVLSFHLTDAKAGIEGREVHGDTASEFPGHFIDDVQVYLTRKAAAL